MTARALWEPTAIGGDGHPNADNETALAAFWRAAELVNGTRFTDYAALHRWSVTDRPAFWRLLWQFAGVQGEFSDGDITTTRVIGEDTMPGARWFPNARLDFTANLLPLDHEGIAILWRDERGCRDSISWSMLRRCVDTLAARLQILGVRDGDRVAAIVANRIESVIAMLAVARLGAIWSSCSPDFGASAIVDRFAQIAPTLLIASDAYDYGGKHFDCRAKVDEVRAQLPSAHHAIWMRQDGTIESLVHTDNHTLADDAELDLHALLKGDGTPALQAPRPFATPLYILFSSGTTGLPKCIVHGAGATLLTHRKEHVLHGDVRAGEHLFFFTTCGWMMWNWLVTGLASKATIALYDGSPFHPGADVLLRYAEEHAIQHFGISPGYLSQLSKLHYKPNAQHNLSSLRTVLSTGSPLPGELFRWCYENLSSTARLSSITGGTDIAGCFALGNPLLPVHEGEIQSPALGMGLQFVDDDGESVPPGTSGELVCRPAFPSMPLQFWDDAGQRKYSAAYFERYPGYWHHGDFGQFTEHGGVIIHGRSDATLNKGGVRIGTAEIYRQLEGIDAVLESLAVSHHGPPARMLLFVRLKPGEVLDDALRNAIRSRLRARASPRHVPDFIIQVADLPRTRSGKLTELAVHDVIHDRPVKNTGALANPESLALFRNLPELR